MQSPFYQQISFEAIFYLKAECNASDKYLRDLASATGEQQQ